VRHLLFLPAGLVLALLSACPPAKEPIAPGPPPEYEAPRGFDLPKPPPGVGEEDDLGEEPAPAPVPAPAPPTAAPDAGAPADAAPPADAGPR
jgi:hypothetical protein